MTLTEQTTQIFEETRAKLRHLFLQDFKQAPNDGHRSYAFSDGEQKGVIIENPRGEKIFVPEHAYNRCFGQITTFYGRLAIADATGLGDFTPEDALLIGDIGHVLRDYKF